MFTDTDYNQSQFIRYAHSMVYKIQDVEIDAYTEVHMPQ